MHEGRIVYQQGADIWVLDLTAAGAAAGGATGAAAGGVNAVQPRKLEIRLTTDNDQLRERWITNPQQYLTSVHVSPNGDRVSLVARGNVFVAPVGAGRFVHATPQSRDHWIRYREARFLPDGKSLLALSDESGEVELWKVPANGVGARTQLTKDAKVLRWNGLPSPDGKFVAHHDKDQRLWLLEVATGADRMIGENPRTSAWISSAQGYFDMAWSPDGRWLAFNDVAENMFGRIALYDTQSKAGTAAVTYLTTDRYDSYSPAFTPDGAWLYFLSDRNLVSVVGSPWGMRSPDPYVESPTKLYAVQLKKGAKWPFAPKTELDPAPAPAAARAAAKKPDPTKSGGGGGASDLDGIEARLFEVPSRPAATRRSRPTAPASTTAPSPPERRARGGISGRWS
jgi:tricorn protease